jgi:transposase
MGIRKGPVKINSYGLDFKLRAVQLSSQPGVLIKDVAESLGIHPFMLSKWRKQVRDGELSGSPPPVDAESVAELQRLREVEKQFKLLQMEHDLLKKVHPVCLRIKGEVFAFIAVNRQGKGRHSMAAVLPDAQHREAGPLRLSLTSRPKPGQPGFEKRLETVRMAAEQIQRTSGGSKR